MPQKTCPMQEKLTLNNFVLNNVIVHFMTKTV